MTIRIAATMSVKCFHISWLALLCAACGAPTDYEFDLPMTEWRNYGQDPGGSRYSDLQQIDRDNVTQLKVAWTFRTGAVDDAFVSNETEYHFEATPLMIGGVLYFSTSSNNVFAIDAESGRELWRFDPRMKTDVGYGTFTSRGVSYWEGEGASAGDEGCARRILLGTLDGRLIALDAADGAPCKDFGRNGEVNLADGVANLTEGMFNVTSPPAVYRNLVIVGTSIGDFRGEKVESGKITAYDAVTGDAVWSWDPVPRSPSDPAWNSWENNSALTNGAANAWAPLSLDAENDLVFAPTSAPGFSFFGGDRPGRNDYSSSIVALRASTGELVWHQQLVHHDVWDYDTSSQPLLADIVRDGRRIPIVAQTGKTGMVYIFNRLTGDPVFPIEERPVPQGGVADERLSPTQPFPTKPAPLVSHDPLRPEDAWGLTFWDRDQCAKLIGKYRSDGIFTPPTEQGSLMTPGIAGGANWGSMSFDKQRNIALVNVNELPFAITVRRIAETPPDQPEPDYHLGEAADGVFIPQPGTDYEIKFDFLTSPFGVPCNAPPWGKLIAIDLTNGETLWTSPLGTTQDVAPWFVPRLKFGVPNMGGSIVTAGGLAFIGAASDDYLRAFDIGTGEEVWKARLPAGGQATPMTYAVNGRQYVVIAAGGYGAFKTTRGDYVLAFALSN